MSLCTIYTKAYIRYRRVLHCYYHGLLLWGDSFDDPTIIYHPSCIPKWSLPGGGLRTEISFQPAFQQPAGCSLKLEDIIFGGGNNNRHTTSNIDLGFSAFILGFRRASRSSELHRRHARGLVVSCVIFYLV